MHGVLYLNWFRINKKVWWNWNKKHIKIKFRVEKLNCQFYEFSYRQTNILIISFLFRHLHFDWSFCWIPVQDIVSVFVVCWFSTDTLVFSISPNIFYISSWQTHYSQTCLQRPPRKSGPYGQVTLIYMYKYLELEQLG